MQTMLTFTLVVTNSIGQVSPPDWVTVTVVPIQADFSITLTDQSDLAISGYPITYTLVVQNGGPDDALGVLITDTLSEIVSGVTWTCLPAPTCPGAGSGTIHVTVDMNAGSTVTFTITGQVAPGVLGNLVHAARVTFSGDPNPLNNDASDNDILVVRVLLPYTEK